MHPHLLHLLHLLHVGWKSSGREDLPTVKDYMGYGHFKFPDNCVLYIGMLVNYIYFFVIETVL